MTRHPNGESIPSSQTIAWSCVQITLLMLWVDMVDWREPCFSCDLSLSLEGSHGGMGPED